MRHNPWKPTFKVEQVRENKPCSVCRKPIKRGLMTDTQWKNRLTCSNACAIKMGMETKARNKAAEHEADGL